MQTVAFYCPATGTGQLIFTDAMSYENWQQLRLVFDLVGSAFRAIYSTGRDQGNLFFIFHIFLLCMRFD
jgi:hypothetical protein